MIKNRQDLKFYLEEDRKRNLAPRSRWRYLLQVMAGSDHVCVFRYLKCLRHCEYHLNNSEVGIFHYTLYLWYRFRLTRLGMKYSLSIRPNVCGYGLRIMHLSGGGGVRIGALKCGNYCGFNAGVLIGTKDGEGNRPVIGDYVAFAPGAKAFGKLKIGNNVFVAPNAVVTKDIPDDCIVGGIPAKIIRYRKDGHLNV